MLRREMAGKPPDREGKLAKTETRKISAWAGGVREGISVAREGSSPVKKLGLIHGFTNIPESLLGARH